MRIQKASCCSLMLLVLGITAGCGGVASTPTLWQHTFEYDSSSTERLVSMKEGEASRMVRTNDQVFVENYDFQGELLEQIDMAVDMGANSQFIETAEGLLWHSSAAAQMVMLDEDWNLLWEYQAYDTTATEPDTLLKVTAIYADQWHNSIALATQTSNDSWGITLVQDGAAVATYDFTEPAISWIPLIAHNDENIYVFARTASGSVGNLYVFDTALALLTSVSDVTVHEMIAIDEGVVFLDNDDMIILDKFGNQLDRKDNIAQFYDPKLQRGEDSFYIYGPIRTDTTVADTIPLGWAAPVFKKYQYGSGLLWSYHPLKTQAHQFGIGRNAVTETRDGRLILSFSELKTTSLVIKTFETRTRRHHLMNADGTRVRAVVEDDTVEDVPFCIKICESSTTVNYGITSNFGVLLGNNDELISLGGRNNRSANGYRPKVLTGY
ncbi:MAG: hypothetical protein MI976_18750 [Pseudomonadales bacterium]|nr:hypothetical protein [Pseudomonadales bacterium]